MAYWQDRLTETQDKLADKSIKQMEKQLKKYYKQSMKKVIEEFEKTCVVSKPTKPNIIVRSNILITKCERCKSIYQAGWEHTRTKAKPGVELLTPENLDFVTECPCCGWYNIVEFEEG